MHRICDPVVMLSKADWIRAVARKEVSQKETISLVYFLGEYQENYFPKVENEAQKNGWCVIDVSRSSKSREAACDPLTFVAYINSAECVYTDSFHAIMLALILNKRVVIFERAGGKEMNTRITELVERYNLQNCVYMGNVSLEKLGTYNIERFHLLATLLRIPLHLLREQSLPLHKTLPQKNFYLQLSHFLTMLYSIFYTVNCL